MSFSNTGNIALMSISTSGRTITPAGIVQIGDIRLRTPAAVSSITFTGSTEGAQFDVYVQTVGGDQYRLVAYPLGTDMSGRNDVILIGNAYDYPSQLLTQFMPLPGSSLNSYIYFAANGVHFKPFASQGTSGLVLDDTDGAPAATWTATKVSSSFAGNRNSLDIQAGNGQLTFLAYTNILMYLLGTGFVARNVGTTTGQSFKLDQYGHVGISQQSAPTPTTNTGAGTAGAPSASVNGSDQWGLLTVNTGTGCAANGTVVSVAYNVAHANIPYGVQLRPYNRATINLPPAQQPIINNNTRSLFSLLAGATALADSTQYQWSYVVMGS